MTLAEELKELYSMIAGKEDTSLEITAAQRSLLLAALYEYAAHHAGEAE